MIEKGGAESAAHTMEKVLINYFLLPEEKKKGNTGRGGDGTRELPCLDIRKGW